MLTIFKHSLFGIKNAAQQLIPGERLQRADAKETNTWKATGKDPYFLLEGALPSGWTEIVWTASSETPLRFRLYIDRGHGFNKVHCYDLGVVVGTKLKKYSAIIPIGNDVHKLRLDPGELVESFRLQEVSFHSISRLQIFTRALGKYFSAHKESSGLNLLQELSGIIIRKGFSGIWSWAKNTVSQPDFFEYWIKYNTFTPEKIEELRQTTKTFSYRPLFSIIVPVYNVEERWLRRCIDSVRDQIYPYWELCIADDASSDPRVKSVLEEYAALDDRIKVTYRKKNGHISAASNSALELATGEYVALLDNDDELTPDALFENAKLLNKHRDADMIYSDEDKMSEEGVRSEPFFKPDWSPDTFLSQMYVGHLGVYRTELVRSVGGFRLGYEGSQDYDLVLRVTEQTTAIYHIPKILYHWRTIAQSTALNPGSKKYAYTAGERSIQDALDRRGENGWVELLPDYPGQYLVHYPPKGNPLVSIILAANHRQKEVAKCLEAIFRKTTYSNFEVLLIGGPEMEQNLKNLIDRFSGGKSNRIKLVTCASEYSTGEQYSSAISEATGDILLFLDGNVQVQNPNWLEEMVGQAVRQEIGAVGAKLLYPNQTIHSAGIISGADGVFGHSHKGYGKNEHGYFGRLLIVANYAAVSGECFMIRRDIFDSLGGLDKKLTGNIAFVDLSFKLLERGLYNVVIPQVKNYYHKIETTVIEEPPAESRLIKERWRKYLDNDPFYSPNLNLDAADFTIAIPPRILSE